MPIIKSAIKKMRQDKKRTTHNKMRKERMKELIKKAQTNSTAENLRVAQSAIDKLAKVKVIHKNKAARMKAKLAELVKSKSEVKTEVRKIKNKIVCGSKFCFAKPNIKNTYQKSKR